MKIDWGPVEVIDGATTETYRKMLPHERLALACAMTEAKRRDVAEQIRKARPDWTEDQGDREFRWTWLCHSGFDDVIRNDIEKLIRPPSLGY